MKQVLILFCLIALSFSSCKKGNQLGKDNTVQPAQKIETRLLNDEVKKIIRAEAREKMKVKDAEVLEKVIAKIKNSQARPGYCPIMNEAYCFADDECNYPGADVTFTWKVIERVAAAETLNYSFMVETNMGQIPVTATQIMEEDLGCDETFDYCLVRRTFQATLNLAPSTMTGNYSTTVSALCTRTGSTAYSIITPTTSFGYQSSDYINSEAKVYPYGMSLKVWVATDCSSLCYGTYVTCPSSVTFKYRLAISMGAYTTVTLPWNGGFISLPVGIYHYIAVANYTGFGGSSQPKEGYFEVTP